MKIKYDLKLKMQLVPPEKFLVLHQYHKPSPAVNCDIKDDSDPIKQRYMRNKKYYENICNFKDLLSKSLSNEIPHIFHCYIGSGSLTYMAYLTIRSFIYYNPSWIINIYVPINYSDTKYSNNYWKDLMDLSVNKIVMNFEKIGFYNDATEINKLNYIKWHILSTVGGLWSDPDILYINSVENTIFKTKKDFDTLIFNINNEYYPIAFFMSKANNTFFAKIKESVINMYKTNNNTNVINILKTKYPTIENIILNFPETKFNVEDKNIYLPFEYIEIDKIYKSNNINSLNKNTIGIYLFQGSDNAQIFNNNLENELEKNDSTISIFINKFRNIVQEDNLLKDIHILNPKYI